MAQHLQYNGVSFFAHFVVFTLLSSTSHAIAFKSVSGSIQRWLTDVHREHSYAHVLHTNFDGDSSIDVKTVDPQKLARNMAQNVNNFLVAKRRALKKVGEHLENASGSYIWDNDLRLNTSHPLLMKDLDSKNDTNMKLDDQLGVRVLRKESGIHVPLEVYEGCQPGVCSSTSTPLDLGLWTSAPGARVVYDPEILNGLKWSSSVDKVFEDNLQSDSTMMWQYFAAQTGFMRVYPAPEWHVPPGLIDLYDARLRPWYVQGSVPPKDMIILMDRSGSVHGQTFNIMKWAVKTLIDTLGENDFVNVAAFNDTTQWVNNCTYCEPTKNETDNCVQPLVQASTSNKKLLFKAIDEQEDGGIASYSDALDFAYRAFKEFAQTRREGEGANCHKAIMLFSDGGTEWPRDIVKKLREDNDTKHVRVFTYAVGPHPIPTAVLKQMACSTGGKYSVITTRSSVRTKIQESYSSLFSPAPPNASANNPPQYTTVYTSAVTEELTISLTRPVYNRSDYTNTSELVGVAGIDIPIFTLKNLSPFESLGANGYMFIINHNGFLVLHPRLHQQLSYLLGPPHIDILEVEEDVYALAEIRRRMIEREIGNESVLGKIWLDESHRLPFSGIRFSFEPISDTSYSLGLVTLGRSNHLIVRDQDSSLIDGMNSSSTRIASWPYCRTRQPVSQSARIKNLKEKDIMNRRSCREDLLQGLLWSIGWTDSLLDAWAKDSPPEGILGRIIYTRYGVARFYPPRQELDERWDDPDSNPALRRGELSSKVSVMPHSAGAFLSSPVIVKKNGAEVMAGVVGVNVTASFLQHNFIIKLKGSLWWDVSEYLVLLLDDGGIIVTANRKHLNDRILQGTFIGDLNVPLLDQLKSEGLYDMDQHTDAQAICREDRDSTFSAGPRSLHVPNPLTVLTAMVLEVFSWAHYLKYLVYSGVLALLTPSAEAWSEWGMTVIGGKESCRMERTFYYFGERKSLNGTLNCTSNFPRFWAERLEYTNAMLVAIEMNTKSTPECGVSSQLPSIEPERVRYVEPCGYQDRFRKQPSNCLMGNSTAGKLGCSGCPRHTEASLALVLTLLALNRLLDYL